MRVEVVGSWRDAAARHASAPRPAPAPCTHLLQDGSRLGVVAQAACPPLALKQRHLQRVGACTQRLALTLQHRVLLLQPSQATRGGQWASQA